MTVLVTGASGFLGCHLVDKLLLREHPVRTLSRSRGDGLPPQIDHIQGDILDVSLLEKATTGIETVYHVAATVPEAGNDALMWDTNVNGTRNMAQACLKAGVQRLVLVSSITVYKPPLSDVVSEAAPVGGVSTYGRSKAMAETVATDISKGRLELVIARPCQIYGTRDRTGYTRKLLGMAKASLLPVVGLRGRSFSLIHVSDVVDGLCAAGERKDVDGAIFNIACEKKTSLLELASIYSKLVGKKARGAKLPIPGSMLRAALSLRWAAKSFRQPQRDSLFGSYGPRSSHGSILLGGPLYDIQNAKAFLDFSPKTNLEQGLLDVIDEEAGKRGAMSPEAADSIAMTRS